MPALKDEHRAARPPGAQNGLKDLGLMKQENRKPNVRKAAKAKNRKTCSLRSPVALGFILICAASAFIVDSWQNQRAVHPPITEMIDPHDGPMFAMTSQDEWCASIVNDHEPRGEYELWPLMANLSAISRAGTFNHKHFSLYPELIVRQLNSTTKAVFILCVTEPTLLLIVDFNSSSIVLGKTDAPCEMTDVFRRSVVKAMRKEPLDGMSFSLTRIGFLFLFTVQVNKETSKAVVNLCKPTVSDQCDNPLGRLLTRFSRLKIGSTVLPVAMLYSESANEFMRSIKLSCKLMHNGKDMCWNPKTFNAEFCD